MADEINFQASAFTAQGTARDKVALPQAPFDGTVNIPVMHQAVKAYLANQRQGTAATKTRGFVVGGNQKPWRQKGTGRARQGSTRSPHWVGGGTVFGPQPRSYRQDVPKQVKALARKSALNARARENAIVVIDQFNFDAPKTSRMQALVDTLGMAEQKVLILTAGIKSNVFMSARNIPNVHVMPYSDVSTYHILWSDVVLIESEALGQSLDPVAEESEEASGKREKSAGRKRSAAEAEGAERKGARKAAAKTAKTAAKTARAAAKKESAAKKPAAKKTAAAKAPAKKKGGK
jgi:large subunit ribosomal protein L4